MELNDLARANQLITQLSQLSPANLIVPPVNGPVRVAGGGQAPALTADELKAQRQQQAANARAAKHAKTSQDAQNANPATQQKPDLLSGTNGGGPTTDDDVDDDLGLSENASSMSPAEAREAGLALVREVYSAGHVAEVKQLQKELSVAKFYDVPVTNGHAFYARVMQLAQGVGLRQ